MVGLVPVGDFGWIGTPGVVIAGPLGFVFVRWIVRLPLIAALVLALGIGVLAATLGAALIAIVSSLGVFLPFALLMSTRAWPVTVFASLLWLAAMRVRVMPWLVRKRLLEAPLLAVLVVAMAWQAQGAWTLTVTTSNGVTCLQMPGEVVLAVAWSSDGDWFGVASTTSLMERNDTVRVVERATMRSFQVWQGSLADPFSVAVGPAGEVFWVVDDPGGKPGDHLILDAGPTSPPVPMATLPSGVGAPNALRWTPDGIVANVGGSVLRRFPFRHPAGGTSGLPWDWTGSGQAMLSSDGWSLRDPSPFADSDIYTVSNGAAEWSVHLPEFYRSPFITPARDAIGYPRYAETGWQLTRVPLDGGAASTMAPGDMYLADLSSRGELLYNPSDEGQVCVKALAS